MLSFFLQFAVTTAPSTDPVIVVVVAAFVVLFVGTVVVSTRVLEFLASFVAVMATVFVTDCAFVKVLWVWILDQRKNAFLGPNSRELLFVIPHELENEKWTAEVSVSNYDNEAC
jgi:hypothetical protein